MINRLFFSLKEMEISQEKLAGHLDVTPATVSRWCSNQAQPSADDLYRIARFLKVGVYDLQYCNTKTFVLAPDKEIKLSSLGSNDAFLVSVIGKTKLQNIDTAILRFTTKRNQDTFSTPLLVQISLYQNPNIPVIEVRKIIQNCKTTVLTLENCKEEVTVVFACPNFATVPTDKVSLEKTVI
jgi:transcriptional regulator with XRE-family HTH domain